MLTASGVVCLTPAPRRRVQQTHSTMIAIGIVSHIYGDGLRALPQAASAPVKLVSPTHRAIGWEILRIHSGGGR